jgi:hypothetical protein
MGREANLEQPVREHCGRQTAHLPACGYLSDDDFVIVEGGGSAALPRCVGLGEFGCDGGFVRAAAPGVWCLVARRLPCG